MTFTLTPDQRAACDAFEKACRELCVGPVQSVKGGFIAKRSFIVVGEVHDDFQAFGLPRYDTGLADRIEQTLQKLYAAQDGSEERKARRLADIEAEAKRLREELAECVA